MSSQDEPYTLSFYAQVPLTIIDHPPWYKFWRKSTERTAMVPRRISCGVNLAIGELMIERAGTEMAVMQMVLELLASAGYSHCTHFQLEENFHPTSYIPTTS